MKLRVPARLALAPAVLALLLAACSQAPSTDAAATPAATPDAPAAPAEIEFAVYSDGRLAIFDGDEILILPPEATRRLGYFLGCLETHVWPPRLDSSHIPA